MTNETNYFAELAKIDVGQYIEKKGNFSYLSWTWAIDQLRRFDPSATWKVLRFKDVNGLELPYLNGPNGAFVEVEVTVKGTTLSQIQPVMDFKNKSVKNPDSMEVNKAIQRCIVKGIALHGLGLYIYAGEDIPNDIISSQQMAAIEKQAAEFVKLRGGTVDSVISALGVGSLVHLTTGQADMALNKLQTWVQKAVEKQQEADAQTAQVETEEATDGSAAEHAFKDNEATA